MSGKSDPSQGETPFLSVDDAEILHGPDVIADKVTGALRDADRFDVQAVKPPLTEALERVSRSGGRDRDEEAEPVEQNALGGEHSKVDEEAGSAEKLVPDVEK